MRSDQLSLCVPCAVRFANRPTCPRCGEPSVDLGSLAARSVARSKLRRLTFWSWLTRPVRRISPGWYIGCSVTGIIVLTLGIGIALGFSFDSPWPALAAYFVVPTVCTVVWVLVLPDPSEFGKKGSEGLPRVARRLRLHRLEPGDPVQPVRGRVALREPVRSPLDGESCAAFRLLGQAGRIEIDDAGVGRFEVLVDGEPQAVVAVEAAGVMLEVGEPKPAEGTDELHEFLRLRGAEPGDPLNLAEAVLRDGDEVVVSGRATPIDRADGGGYRSTAQVMAFEDEPDEPLWIRGG